MSHPMNPFDFVPFPTEKPVIKSVDEWFGIGDLKTGYFDVTLKTLTPLHIVGLQDTEPDGKRITKSHFLRRGGKAVIPGSTIRGMLRGFMEAACNGWASQMTTHYEKVKGTDDVTGRQIGFHSHYFPDLKELQNNEDESIDRTLKAALPEGFAMPYLEESGETALKALDLPSFLFGYLNTAGKGFQGRVSIDDAVFDSSKTGFGSGKYSIPDINSSAFMGGGKPNAASWWYLHPHSIRLKPFTKNGQTMYSVVFVGERYRGRKFYYHQNPVKCVEQYFDKSKWPSDPKRPIYRFNLECLPVDTEVDFRIHFKDLPQPLLKLLMIALCPGNKIRHKLGYGKAYGYGSIALTIHDGVFQGSGFDPNRAFLAASESETLGKMLWDWQALTGAGLTEYLHQTNIDKLGKILWYDEGKMPIMMYPPFGEGGFLPVVYSKHVLDNLDQNYRKMLNDNKRLTVNNGLARKLSNALARIGRRPALHFDVYKENSNDYTTVEQRSVIRN